MTRLFQAAKKAPSKSGVQVSALTQANHCPHLIIYVLLADTLELQAEKQDAHNGWVMSVGYNSDGDKIVSGGQEGTIKVWDAGAGPDILKPSAHT